MRVIDRIGRSTGIWALVPMIALIADPVDLISQKKIVDPPITPPSLFDFSANAARHSLFLDAAAELQSLAPIPWLSTGYDGRLDLAVYSRVRTADGFLLAPTETLLVDIGASFRAGEDVENWRKLLARLRPLMPERVRARVMRDSEIDGASIEALRDMWRTIGDAVGTEGDPTPGGRRPVGTDNPIDVCEREIGSQNSGADGELSERCDLVDYSPRGIVGTTDFPLRNHLTCIKDQGTRGTCVAQTIAAMLETMRSVEDGLLQNLSEQDLYFQSEIGASPTIPDMFLDALHASLVLPYLDSIGYQVQYESVWNYARSTGRTGFVVDSTHGVGSYPGSCGGEYTGEQCSKWASHGRHTFLRPGVPSTVSRPALPPAGAASITSVTVLPVDPTHRWRPALAAVELLVEARIPVFIGMAVTDDLSSDSAGRGVDADGYVHYSGSTTRDGVVPGGHAMMCIGFIPRGDLPSGAPLPTGRGYFIFKNSWGTRSGDCGFYYVDEAYLAANAAYIAVFERG